MANQKPRSIQGYEITEIYHNVKIPSRDPNRPHDTSMSQKNMGLGVNGPNISEPNPDKLIALGKFLIASGKFIQSEERKAKKRREAWLKHKELFGSRKKPTRRKELAAEEKRKEERSTKKTKQAVLR